MLLLLLIKFDIWQMIMIILIMLCKRMYIHIHGALLTGHVQLSLLFIIVMCRVSCNFRTHPPVERHKCCYSVHTRIVLSALPEYSFFPTVARHNTLFECPSNAAMCWCVSVLHTCTVASSFPEYNLSPTIARARVNPRICNVAMCWCVSVFHTRRV